MSGVFRIGLKIVGAVLTKHVKVIIEMSRVLHPLHWKDIINTSVLIAKPTQGRLLAERLVASQLFYMSV